MIWIILILVELIFYGLIRLTRYVYRDENTILFSNDAELYESLSDQDAKDFMNKSKILCLNLVYTFMIVTAIIFILYQFILSLDYSVLLGIISFILIITTFIIKTLHLQRDYKKRTH